MTRTRILEVVSYYEDLLAKKGHSPTNLRGKDALGVPFEVCPSHALNMLPKIRELLAAETPTAHDTEKAMRWLGFVQGVIWTCRLRTIDKMAKDNKGPAGAPFDP